MASAILKNPAEKLYYDRPQFPHEVQTWQEQAEEKDCRAGHKPELPISAGAVDSLSPGSRTRNVPRPVAGSAKLNASTPTRNGPMATVSARARYVAAISALIAGHHSLSNSKH